MNKIKNCPFCGGTPTTGIKYFFRDCYGIKLKAKIMCTKCHVEESALVPIDDDKYEPFETYIKGFEDAISKWNGIEDEIKKGKTMQLLTLDDAVKVARELVLNEECDDAIIRQELEQKCLVFDNKDDAVRQLNSLASDINVSEICEQIEANNLNCWCTEMQIAIKGAIIRLKMHNKE